MPDTALNHLPIALAFLALLIAHLFRLAERISPAAKKRAPSRRLQPAFAHRERNGDLVLVDPDGRVSRPRQR
ncbi:MAG TPA: hypothetical protein VMU71_11830 [Terracidiphilus sp.]|nr:hypothetical protein [Terracidiphilus sp.]